MAGLRPPALEEAGVVAAIDYLSRESGGREGPKMEFFHAVRFDRLPPLLETTLFRIAQESLANACRHSRSEKVRISLVEVGESVRLEVQDWGIGFTPDEVEDERFGLAGIRERARLLGGNTTIEGHFHPGTNPFACLSPEQMQFLLTFIRCEGRFNRMEEELGLSYPTLRNRFNEILRSLGFEPGREEAPVRLTAEDRMRILDELAEGLITSEEAQQRILGKKEEAVEK